MECFQLYTGDATLAEVIDRVATDAAAVAPGLGRDRARELVDLIFRTRVTQTVACGHAPACQEVGAALWGTRRPPQGSARPACLADSDPYALPRVFAAAAADLIDLGDGERDYLEERLAGAFHAALAPLLFRNPSCGRASVCASKFTDPFATDEP